MSEMKKRDKVSPATVDVIVTVVTFSVAVGGTFVLWGIGAGQWTDDPFVNVVGWIGAFISLVGVLFAYLIFRRQARQAKAAELASRGLMGKLHKLIVRVEGKIDGIVETSSEQVPDAEISAGGDEPDRWEADTPEPEPEPDLESATTTEPSAPSSAENAGEVYLNGGRDGKKRRRMYSRKEIPLSVIGALVGQWREAGHTGRWELSALIGGFRAVGKGNHPWFLVFRVPGTEQVELWKVTRGPNDKDTAIRLATPDDMF